MELNKVYFKDARNMSEVEDASITLIVTSPPYWSVKDYSLDGFQEARRSAPMEGQIGDIGNFQHYIQAMLPVWEECFRVLRPNGKLCINSPLMPIEKAKLNTHHTRNIVDINSAIQNSILSNLEFHLFDVWIWNRANPTKKLMFGSYPHPPNFYAQNTIEFITVYVKDGRPPKVDKSRKARSMLTEAEWVEFTKQVWNIPIPNKSDVAYGEHPAIMPKEIAERFIRLFSFVDDVVLDPFMGSGTTAKAAVDSDRKWIGYEIDKSFEQLIFAKVGQGRLF